MQYTEAFTITKADQDDIDITVRGFITSQSGTVRILTYHDVVVDIPVIAGQIYPISVKRILSTGTTVGVIVGLA